MLVSMNDVLLPAKKHGYGVGFFNAVNVEMARAIIESAEKLNAPVMIGTAEVLLPSMPLECVASYLIPMAQKAKVPVCVHMDHALSFETCLKAVELGFSSVMYDCSTLSYEENVKEMKRMTDFCHKRRITVEGELGHVGDNEGEGKLLNPSDFYTNVDVAEDFVKKTGIDSLAVAVGNAHGDYKFPPKLDFERISAISDKTGIPLVLHGGSGLSDNDFKEAVKRGICKINIFTDLDKAGKKGLENGMQNGANSIFTLIPYEIDAMKSVVENKIKLFGAVNRA